MDKATAIAIVKTINRRARRGKIMGGRGMPDYGVDYATWSVTYPHLSSMYCKAGQIITGNKNGRFSPRFP